jgi:hypothetical protein
MNWPVVYPEIWLLAHGLRRALVDLFVTAPERGPPSG